MEHILVRHSVKIYLKRFIIFICCIFVIFHFIPQKNEISKIKVFLEVYATNPVLWESIEFAKSAFKDDELKVFFFHRFPDRSNLFDLEKINAIEINLIKKEGYYPANSRNFINHLKQISDKYPGVPLEIYSNINQTRYYLLPLIFELGNRIEHIHLYEDGACNILGFEYENLKQFVPNEKLIKERKNSSVFIPMKPTENLFWKASIGKLVSATYHLCKGDEIIKDKNLKEYVTWIGAENIKKTDLREAANSLSYREKKFLERFFEIDTKQMKSKKFNEKKLFLTAAYYFNNKKLVQQEIDTFSLLKNAPYRVFIKCHPSYDAQKECSEIQKVFPKWEKIKSTTPLEAFFLTGHEPDKIGGFSSSLYFLIPPEKILFVKGLLYMKRLKDLGVINEETQYIPSFNSR